MSVIDKLDIRRAQVLVEAIIVERRLEQIRILGSELGGVRSGQHRSAGRRIQFARQWHLHRGCG